MKKFIMVAVPTALIAILFASLFAAGVLTTRSNASAQLAVPTIAASSQQYGVTSTLMPCITESQVEGRTLEIPGWRTIIDPGSYEQDIIYYYLAFDFGDGKAVIHTMGSRFGVGPGGCSEVGGLVPKKQEYNLHKGQPVRVFAIIATPAGDFRTPCVAFTLTDEADSGWQGTDFQVEQKSDIAVTYYIKPAPVIAQEIVATAPLADGTPTVHAALPISGNTNLPGGSVLTLRLGVYSIREAKRLTEWQEERQVAVSTNGRFGTTLELDSIPRPVDSMVCLQVVFDPTTQGQSVRDVVGAKGEALAKSVQLISDEVTEVSRLSYERSIIRFPVPTQE